MANVKFSTVDEYVGTFPKDIQEGLTQIRRAIKNAEPKAEEVISYNLPAFKFHGWLIYFSAYKSHYGISFPPPFTVFRNFIQDLSPYKVSKSAVQFPFSMPIPLALIKKMVQFRARENLELEKKKIPD